MASFLASQSILLYIIGQQKTGKAPFIIRKMKGLRRNEDASGNQCRYKKIEPIKKPSKKILTAFC